MISRSDIMPVIKLISDLGNNFNLISEIGHKNAEPVFISLLFLYGYSISLAASNIFNADIAIWLSGNSAKVFSYNSFDLLPCPSCP